VLVGLGGLHRLPESPGRCFRDAIDADLTNRRASYTAWMVINPETGGIGWPVFALATCFSFSAIEQVCKASARRAPADESGCGMALIPATLVVLGLLVMRRWPERGCICSGHQR